MHKYTIDTAYFERCIQTLEMAYKLLLTANPDKIDYDLYHSACIKEFEIILEQAGKLLRKSLKPYFIQPKRLINSTSRIFSEMPF